MNTTALPLHTTHPRLHPTALFTLLALPGALLVGTCGPLIVNASFNGPNVWHSTLLACLLTLGAALLLFGTRTTREPLFLIVFVPMPILLTIGFQLGYLGKDTGLLITLAAAITPVIAYRRISKYYKRKATTLASHRSADVLVRSNIPNFGALQTGDTATNIRGTLRARTPALRRPNPFAAAHSAADQSSIYHASLASHILRVTNEPRTATLRFPRLPLL